MTLRWCLMPINQTHRLAKLTVGDRVMLFMSGRVPIWKQVRQALREIGA